MSLLLLWCGRREFQRGRRRSFSFRPPPCYFGFGRWEPQKRPSRRWQRGTRDKGLVQRTTVDRHASLGARGCHFTTSLAPTGSLAPRFAYSQAAHNKKYTQWQMTERNVTKEELCVVQNSKRLLTCRLQLRCCFHPVVLCVFGQRKRRAI